MSVPLSIALRHTFPVLLVYVAITLLMTWPIAARLERDLPADLGDPAFVAGVIAWGSEHWLALLGGKFTAAVSFWNAPIFAPEPLALAYSEHFALHSLITLPAYALTGNPILCYNLSFLSTFAIGAFGMYLLVRDLVGDSGRFSAPAFVAGVAFAFAPYRIAAMAHLQVLSTYWMPFVLLGIHRYFRQGNTTWLLAAGACLWAQNMSSGYYMLFFGPFVAAFAMVHVVAQRAYRRFDVWRDLAMTALVSFAATLPFVLPYLERTRGTRRATQEIVAFSADLQGWLTASPLLHVWGHLQTFPKAEGGLFPGLTIISLAIAGLWRGWRRHSTATAFAALTFVFAFWLSLGPDVQFGTSSTGVPSLYGLLMNLPGFNAARVPARFATMGFLALAILCGVAFAGIPGRTGVWVAALCSALILAEGSALPLPTNGTWTSVPGQILPPPSRLYRLQDAPGAYALLAQLPEAARIAHFPFGLLEREIQYGYYSMLHRRRIVNGYSGTLPPTYNARLAVLREPLADMGLTQATLDRDGVTHLVVHTLAYQSDSGLRLVEQLERQGWRRQAVVDGDYVLER